MCSNAFFMSLLPTPCLLVHRAAGVSWLPACACLKRHKFLSCYHPELHFLTQSQFALFIQCCGFLCKKQNTCGLAAFSVARRSCSGHVREIKTYVLTHTYDSKRKLNPLVQNYFTCQSHVSIMAFVLSKNVTA